MDEAVLSLEWAFFSKQNLLRRAKFEITLRTEPLNQTISFLYRLHLKCTFQALVNCPIHLLEECVLLRSLENLLLLKQGFLLRLPLNGSLPLNFQAFLLKNLLNFLLLSFQLIFLKNFVGFTAEYLSKSFAVPFSFRRVISLERPFSLLSNRFNQFVDTSLEFLHNKGDSRLWSHLLEGFLDFRDEVVIEAIQPTTTLETIPHLVVKHRAHEIRQTSQPC